MVIWELPMENATDAFEQSLEKCRKMRWRDVHRELSYASARPVVTHQAERGSPMTDLRLVSQVKALGNGKFRSEVRIVDPGYGTEDVFLGAQSVATHALALEAALAITAVDSTPSDCALTA